MGHFVVWVLDEDIEEALDPYKELGDWYIEGDPNSYEFEQYREFAVEVEAAQVENYCQEVLTKVRELVEEDPENLYLGGNQTWTEVLERYEGYSKEGDCESIINSWDGYLPDPQGSGSFVSITNPNTKWDWWSYGGRFHDFLIPQKGKGTDVLPIGKIDFGKTPIPFAMVIDGEWLGLEYGAEEDLGWEKEARKILEEILEKEPDRVVNVIDCHMEFG